ncbi:MAG TPA: hypothetical protein VF077_08885 [Nitrospiraceae bacterium]
MNDATNVQQATIVELPEVTFSLSTTDPTTKSEHITVVTCKAGPVLMDYLVGALTAGASRRTRFQNGLKPTKANPKGQPIPGELNTTWSEWVGEEKAARVIIQTKPMTREEVMAEMLKDPGYAQKMLDEFYEKRAADEKAANADKGKKK